MTAVASLGASPVLVQQARTLNRDMFTAAADGGFDQRYFELFSHFDAVLDVFAYQPVVLGYEIGAEQFQRYRVYMARLFGELMKAKRFTQIRVPTAANAEESGLEPEEYISRMNRAYDIDYEALGKACEQKITQFSKANLVDIHTGSDCVLHLDLSGRRWHRDAGDGDLPCGEVYIAPLESKTCGKIFFQTMYLEEKAYSGVTLTVEDGAVTASSDEELWTRLSEQPRENRVVCEFGMGLNPNVTDLCGCTLLDEKMAGTFHIALGANQMFGGMNTVPNHDDFVGQGRIEVVG